MKTLMTTVTENEIIYIEKAKSKRDLTIDYTSIAFGDEIIDTIDGHEAIIVIGSDVVSRDQFQRLKEKGVKVLVTRTAGYDRIDLEAAESLGIQVANVPLYSPNAISELTLGLAISSVRDLSGLSREQEKYMFLRPAHPSKEIRNMTVGVIGAGNIGSLVVKNFKALGANVLINDIVEREELKAYGTYVSLERLCRECDLITLHTPLDVSTYHTLDHEQFALMKEDVCIINTARGAAINADALVEALKKNRIGRVALDVYEFETGIFWTDKPSKSDEVFRTLVSDHRVIITPHIAYYTDEAVKNMVEYSLDTVEEFHGEGVLKNSVI